MIGRATLKEEYFSWICNLTGSPRRSYMHLCKELYSKPFRWTVRNDDNRCADGMALRERFVEARNLDESHLEVVYFLRGECTVLEVLVALAQRMNDMMYDLNDTQRNKTGTFFRHMLTNLELDGFTDDKLPDDRSSLRNREAIDLILDRFLDRKYAPDGRGGLFPLNQKRHREDQTRVEIWYQMMNWLDENYG